MADGRLTSPAETSAEARRRDGGAPAEDEGRGDQDAEWLELLNELRVALPGVQVLFAFLLTVAFTQRFQEVTPVQRSAFTATLLCTAVATGFLLAPSAYHRLLWRQRDKENTLQVSNRLSIAGIAFLAMAMVGAIFLIADLLYGFAATVGITVAAALFFGWLWYGLGLTRRLSRGARRT